MLYGWDWDGREGEEEGRKGKNIKKRPWFTKHVLIQVCSFPPLNNPLRNASKQTTVY